MGNVYFSVCYIIIYYYLFIFWENGVEDTTAAVLMVDKYGDKDTPGNMAVNTRLPTHAL